MAERALCTPSSRLSRMAGRILGQERERIQSAPLGTFEVGIPYPQGGAVRAYRWRSLPSRSALACLQSICGMNEEPADRFGPELRVGGVEDRAHSRSEGCRGAGVSRHDERLGEGWGRAEVRRQQTQAVEVVDIARRRARHVSALEDDVGLVRPVLHPNQARRTAGTQSAGGCEWYPIAAVRLCNANFVCHSADGEGIPGLARVVDPVGRIALRVLKARIPLRVSGRYEQESALFVACAATEGIYFGRPR